MALFKNKDAAAETTAEKSEAGATTKPQKTAKVEIGRDLSHVLRRPRITEKAVLATDKHVYTFEIDPKATKHDVRDAVMATYSVTPVKVRIVNKQSRRYVSRTRARTMTAKGLKKAYVYLKEGDRIDLV